LAGRGSPPARFNGADIDGQIFKDLMPLMLILSPQPSSAGSSPTRGGENKSGGLLPPDFSSSR
jgi:hypothetical protein